MAEETTQPTSENAKKAAELYRGYQKQTKEITHAYRAKATELIDKIDAKKTEEIKNRIASS